MSLCLLCVFPHFLCFFVWLGWPKTGPTPRSRLAHTSPALPRPCCQARLACEPRAWRSGLVWTHWLHYLSDNLPVVHIIVAPDSSIWAPPPPPPSISGLSYTYGWPFTGPDFQQYIHTLVFKFVCGMRTNSESKKAQDMCRNVYSLAKKGR